MFAFVRLWHCPRLTIAAGKTAFLPYLFIPAYEKSALHFG